jgi:CHAD domain-containing protein
MSKRRSDRAASEVVKDLLLKIAEELAAALSHFRRREESVHDSRVAIRKIRSILKMYRKYLGPWSLKAEESFASLARSTDRLRDAEVQTTWLIKNRNGSRSKQCKEIENLIRVMDAERVSELAKLRRAWIPKCKIVMMRLRRRLATSVTQPKDRLFKEAFRRVLKKRARRLRKSLQRIERTTGIEDLHTARIRVKELRYVIAPFRRGSARQSKAHVALERLQTSLGKLHDIEVFKKKCRGVISSDGPPLRFGRVAALLRRQEKKVCKELQNLLSRRAVAHALKALISP